VRKLEALGCRRIFEVGPGKVLKGLIKRVSSSLEVENFATAQDFVRARRESAA
jgi:malonyl CoA-acyl carrier protein transacylase